MITACFDGAGKWEDAKTPIVAVVGFCSMARVWADFEREWLKVLKDFSIPYFHPLLFAHSYEHFKSFKDDEEKRRNLVSGLLDVIASCGLRKFGAFIKKKDLEKAKYAMGLNGDVTVDAFVLCARSAVDDLYAYAKNEGITKNIRTVFDKGDSETY